MVLVECLHKIKEFEKQDIEGPCESVLFYRMVGCVRND